jgi:hypothetical protein
VKEGAEVPKTRRTNALAGGSYLFGVVRTQRKQLEERK